LTPQATDRVLVSGVHGTPPPDTLKVGANVLGGFRNAVTFVLCGLHIEEKAALVREQLVRRVGREGLEFVLARTDRPDADTEQAACALLAVHLKDPDPGRAGRAFSQAAVELALASYPGCTLTAPPSDATPWGVFQAHELRQDAVEHVAVRPDGTRVEIPPPGTTAPRSSPLQPAEAARPP